MDYETALALKNAGFPQTGSKMICPHGYQGYLPDGCQKDQCGVSYPTLEELIEACGKEFWKLEYFDAVVGWAAYEYSFHKGLNIKRPKMEKGPTPTEAVARLYLALHPTAPSQSQ